MRLLRRIFVVAVSACLVALPLAAPSALGSGGAVASAGTCSGSKLVIWLPNGGGNGAAGSVYYKLRLTNLGSKSCTLSGFPRVSAVDLEGRRVGNPATRETNLEVETVTLAPKGSASFRFQVTEAGNFSPADCRPTMAAGLRVTPPAGGGAKLVPFPFETCAKPTQPVLRVGPVRKGS